MKKAEFIAKYGIERYNENLKFNRENQRKHREENPNWEKERCKKKESSNETKIYYIHYRSTILCMEICCSKNRR